jgi:hypothetical protein
MSKNRNFMALIHDLNGSFKRVRRQVFGRSWSKRLRLLEAQQHEFSTKLEPMPAQIEHLTDRFGELSGRIEDLSGRVETASRREADEQAIIDSVPAIARELRQLGETRATEMRNLEQRVEFIRRELMYELHYAGAGSTPTSEAEAASGAPEKSLSAELTPKVVDAQKIEELRKQDLRLNLGCGHVPMAKYVNVDMRELPGVDVVAGVDNLPFEPGTVSEIFSSHLVEHFPHEMLVRRLLPHWHALLQEGGVLTVVAPDGPAMIDSVARGEISFDIYREVLFGAQEYIGDFHYNLLAPDEFAEVLAGAGFANVTIKEKARRNGLCYEFEISARKLSTTGSPAGVEPV